MDIHTLIVVTAIAGFGSAYVVFFIHRLRFSAQGILFWAYGSFATACGLILLSFRGVLPNIFTIVFANTLVTYGYALTWSGMRNFFGRRPMLKTTLIAPLFIIPFLLWYSEMQPSLWVRIVGCSLAIAAFSAAISYELLRGSQVSKRLAYQFEGYVFAINSAIFLLRIVFTVLYRLQEISYFRARLPSDCFIGRSFFSSE